MVINPFNLSFVWIFVLWMITAGLAYADVVVESNIDQNSGQVNFPLSGTLTVTYDQQFAIDPKTFQLEGKPLDVSLVKTVSLPGSTQISIYKFSLPPQAKGIHTLPPIAVKVGDKTYQSLPTSYEVGESIAPSFTHIASTSTAPPQLRLEAFVRGPKTLFLGERTTLVYRIAFNRSIDLTKSELPMIHTRAFLKVGDAQIGETQQGEMTLQEISQVIEASQLGNFQLGPSFIEGYAYSINELGRKEYESQLLRANAAAVDLIVNAFPLPDQPASFNGAIGTVRPDITMTSSSQIQIGDTVSLSINLAGVTNLTDLHLPPLSCQPGFSGLFQVNDLPPAGEIQAGMKKFQLELKPLSSLVNEIPSIELSSYDLKAKKYHIAKTEPIPLKVSPLESKPEIAAALPKQLVPTEEFLKGMLAHSVPPVEIRGVEVNAGNRQISWLQKGWSLLVLPIGLLILFWQYERYQISLKRPRPKVLMSELLLNKAQRTGENPDEGIKLIEGAVWERLIEGGFIAEHYDRSVEQLAAKGKIGQARAFLLRLQSLQYSAEKEYHLSELVQEARQLLLE